MFAVQTIFFQLAVQGFSRNAKLSGGPALVAPCGSERDNDGFHLSFLQQALTSEAFPSHQHLNANIRVSIDGDSASGRVMCFNPQEMSLPGGGSQLFMLGLWYVDRYRRTEAGWRIESRVEEKSWVFNTPDFMQL